jgi:RimJ/RimL family protein N-acetyltransferase
MRPTLGKRGGAQLGLQIRAATIDDAPDLAVYAARLFSEALPGIFERPAPTLEDEREFMKPYLDSANSVLFVAQLDGEVVGLLDFRGEALREQAHCGVFGVSVAREHRGGGIGTALIEALFAWAPAHGIRRIEALAWENNPRALALYERLGFEREGRLRKAVIRNDEPIDVLVLARLLVA